MSSQMLYRYILILSEGISEDEAAYNVGYRDGLLAGCLPVASMQSSGPAMSCFSCTVVAHHVLVSRHGSVTLPNLYRVLSQNFPSESQG